MSNALFTFWVCHSDFAETVVQQGGFGLISNL